MRYTTCALAFSCLLAATACFGPATVAQEVTDDAAVRDLRGIDLVVLVDVSGSMGRQSNGNPASDPERIRWDAVKLLLDLFGPADRIMIQRFNESCPAGFEGIPEKDRKAYKKALEDNWFPNRDIGFPGVLQQLTDTNRPAIAASIDEFNRTDDNLSTGERYLDYGGTKIVGALMSAAVRIKNASAVRTPQVVLLTDGLDDDYRDGRFRDGELETALAEFKDGRIPVHIVGLNLQSMGQDQSRLARDLLTNISHLSGGHFFEVENSERLTEEFVNLIRQIKGYWVDEIEYLPARDGTSKLATSLVINGVIDLGILSYEKPANPVNRKDSIRPPRKVLESIWVSSEPNPLKKSAPRTGKNNTLYRYSYFGPELDVSKGLGPSPFKDLQSLGRLELNMQGDEAEDSAQRLLLLKGTAELFLLQNPKAGATYYRNETLQIQLKMLPSAHFAPGQFEAKARFRPVGTRDFDDISKIVTVDLAPFSTAIGRGFQASLPLSALSRLSPADVERNAYEVTVSMRGRGAPEIADHTLSGNHLELPPRVFTVTNYLSIKPLEDVVLSNTTDKVEISVETGFEVEEDITLNFKLTPPKPNDPALAEPKLLVSPNEGSLILKRGKGKIQVELDKDALPARGVIYQPGAIILSHPEDMRMNSAEELTALVRLNLDLGRVGFDPQNLTELLAGQEGTKSVPIKMRLIPADQAGFSDQTVNLTLRQLPTDAPKRAGSTPQSDSESTAEDEAVDSKTTFAAEELWLAQTDDDLPADQRSQSLTDIKIGRAFHIHLHAQGEKTQGKYPFVLTVTGDQLAPAELRFEVSVNAPNIELESAPPDVMGSMTLYAAPGESVSGVFRGWLSSSALEGRSYPVHVRQSFVGQKVLFKSAAGDEAHFEVGCPHEDEPVLLSAGKDHAKLLPFEVVVPEGTTYGRYSAELELTGRGVNPRTVILNVVVNEFVFEINSRDATGKPIWQVCNDGDLIQLADLGTTRWLRLRTQMNDSIDNPDRVTVQLAGPFKDEAGDVIRLPKHSTELSADKQSIWMKVDFQGEPNFNSRGEPYTIAVVADGSQLHVANASFTFRVRFLVVDNILNTADVSALETQE